MHRNSRHRLRALPWCRSLPSPGWWCIGNGFRQRSPGRNDSLPRSWPIFPGDGMWWNRRIWWGSEKWLIHDVYMTNIYWIFPFFNESFFFSEQLPLDARCQKSQGPTSPSLLVRDWGQRIAPRPQDSRCRLRLCCKPVGQARVHDAVRPSPVHHALPQTGRV